jgi:uncharacterized protein with HEPN domain
MSKQHVCWNRINNLRSLIVHIYFLLNNQIYKSIIITQITFNQCKHIDRVRVYQNSHFTGT